MSSLRTQVEIVTKWHAEWLALYADLAPLDRMRCLALECASERYWRDRQEAFAYWREVKRSAATESREQVDHAHKMACLVEFADGELFRLLAKHRPDLSPVFGPAAEHDETYTPRDRAERCNAVWARLTTPNGAAPDIDSSGLLLDAAMQWAQSHQAVEQCLTLAEVARGFDWWAGKKQRRPDSAKVHRLALADNGKTGKAKRISQKTVMDYAKSQGLTFDFSLPKEDGDL